MRPRPNRLRRSFDRRTRFAKIWFRLLLVRIRLSVLGYQSFIVSPIKVNPNKANVKPKQFALAVERAAKYVPGALCLAQAITAQRGLARLGYNTTIRIGVKSDEQANLLAHAWLIYEGHVILGGNDSQLEQYETMTDMNSAVVG